MAKKAEQLPEMEEYTAPESYKDCFKDAKTGYFPNKVLSNEFATLSFHVATGPESLSFKCTSGT